MTEWYQITEILTYNVEKGLEIINNPPQIK